MPEKQQTTIENPQDYIILPRHTHGNYSYPDLLVSKYRLGLTPEVEKAAKTLGLTLKETATEQNGRGYIGNINWDQSLRLNLELASFTLPPRQYVDFLELLKSGRAVDGTGKQVKPEELLQIYEEIIKVRNPYRAELLDADFKEVRNKLNINYNHRIVGGKLQPQNSESLEDCLMENCYVDLASANKQGLPTRKSKSQEIYYRCPMRDNNSVAGFDAYSDRAYLDCDGGAAGSDAGLGVRRALLLEKVSEQKVLSPEEAAEEERVKRLQDLPTRGDDRFRMIELD